MFAPKSFIVLIKLCLAIIFEIKFWKAICKKFYSEKPLTRMDKIHIVSKIVIHIVETFTIISS